MSYNYTIIFDKTQLEAMHQVIGDSQTLQLLEKLSLSEVILLKTIKAIDVQEEKGIPDALGYTKLLEIVVQTLKY